MRAGGGALVVGVFASLAGAAGYYGFGALISDAWPGWPEVVKFVVGGVIGYGTVWLLWTRL